MKCNFSIVIFGAFSSHKKSKTTSLYCPKPKFTFHCLNFQFLQISKKQQQKNTKGNFFWNFQKQTKSEATLGQLCFIKFWGFDFLVNIWRSFRVLEFFFLKRRTKFFLTFKLTYGAENPPKKSEKKLKKVMCTQICDWTLSLRGKCRFSIFVGHTVPILAVIH